MINFPDRLFFYLIFFSLDIHESQDCDGMRRAILTPLHQFHLIHKHSDINRAIAAESSTLHVALHLCNEIRNF